MHSQSRRNSQVRVQIRGHLYQEVHASAPSDRCTIFRRLQNTANGEAHGEHIQRVAKTVIQSCGRLLTPVGPFVYRLTEYSTPFDVIGSTEILIQLVMKSKASPVSRPSPPSPISSRRLHYNLRPIRRTNERNTMDTVYLPSSNMWELSNHSTTTCQTNKPTCGHMDT